jgi:nuclear RNA export factor
MLITLSEILRRFPGLLILDGISLNRIVFPIERRPRIRPDESQRAALSAVPFIYPADIQGGFTDLVSTKDAVMAFCAKYVFVRRHHNHLT